jgi:multimeric flavodoxin WrbA/protein-tyrosine-phosphatase
MLVLGLQGSPRKKGNTAFLLDTFMAEAAALGAETQVIDVCRRDIRPCLELVVCEKKGFCPIHDEMETRVYGLLRRAEVVVAATPIFFYNATAQLKALIDRCQTLWARRYRFKLRDPLASERRGIVLAVAATKGAQLFDGLNLTAKYFFDAIDARFSASLTYRQIEHAGDMARHPRVREDVARLVQDQLAPLARRSKVLFVSGADDCSSQMARALTMSRAGARIEALCAGTQPADRIDPLTLAAMAENGLDLAFLQPCPVDDVVAFGRLDLVVTLDEGLALPPVLADVRHQHWDVSGSGGADLAGRLRLSRFLEEKIDTLLQQFNP